MLLVNCTMLCVRFEICALLSRVLRASMGLYRHGVYV